MTTHKLIGQVLPQLFRKNPVIKLTELKRELQKRTGKTLREDYLLCNLMGKNYIVDCKDRIVAER